jgi:hypothetical protein
MQTVIVSIVVDPDFGQRLDGIAERGPVWIAATPANCAAAERWWRAHYPYREHEGVTTFVVAPSASAEQRCLDVLPTVDLHYGAYDDNPPSYDAVQVLGAQPTPELIDFLAENGYTEIRAWPGGFRAGRIEPAA